MTVEHLLEVVKQLSPAEFREFAREFATLQEQNGVKVESRSKDRDKLPDIPSGRMEEEAALLAAIEENSHLPAVKQRRFNRLRRKRFAETLTKLEEAELKALWQRVEQMNVTRLEALTKLAQQRGTDVRTLMRELGLGENRDVF